MSGLPYRTSEEPPYPALEVVLSNGPYQHRDFAKVDSGASCTCVPQRMIDSLNALAADEAVLCGFDGRAQAVSTYCICIAVVEADWPSGVPNRFEDVEVCAIADCDSGEPAELLIGRDLLSNWRLLLDGPAAELRVEG